MLADLGFYHGKIDGQMGTGTRSAVTAFAAAQGIDAGPYYSTGAICQAIMDAYTAKHAPAPAAPAPVAAPAPALSTRLFLNPAIMAAFAKSRATTTAGGAAAPGAGGGITGWWGSQSTPVKIGIGVAVAALLGLGIYAATSKPKAATPNARRHRPRGRKSRCAITGVRTCRCKPRKGYPRRRSAYALPECWMYPLTSRAKVRNAASRFGKYKHRYAPAERAKIAARIDRAKRRFHIGEYR
jgi:peptidoglycan hydrolase-like protein with peptidoglycan-binding domain